MAVLQADEAGSMQLLVKADAEARTYSKWNNAIKANEAHDELYLKSAELPALGEISCNLKEVAHSLGKSFHFCDGTGVEALDGYTWVSLEDTILQRVKYNSPSRQLGEHTEIGQALLNISTAIHDWQQLVSTLGFPAAQALPSAWTPASGLSTAVRYNDAGNAEMLLVNDDGVFKFAQSNDAHEAAGNIVGGVKLFVESQAIFVGRSKMEDDGAIRGQSLVCHSSNCFWVEISDKSKAFDPLVTATLGSQMTLINLTLNNPKPSKHGSRNVQAIWRSTKRYVESSTNLLQASKLAYSRTIKVAYDPDYKFVPCDNPVVLVEDNDTVTAATREALFGNKVLLINFANNKDVGGGYNNGAVAQEEDVMRRTTLAFALDPRNDIMTQERFVTLYNINKGYSANGLYTPGVAIIRSGRPSYNYPANVPLVDVLSIASYSNIDKTEGGDHLMFNDDGTMTPPARQAIKERIALQFQTAHAAEKDTLITGAIGCGVFQNNVDEVIAIFNEVLAEYRGMIPKVIFVILGGTTPIFQAFDAGINKIAPQ